MNTFSKRVVDVSNSLLPAVWSHWREEPDGTASIKLKSPSGHKLWIATFGDEITVGFDQHHCHFGDCLEPDPAEDLARAAEYVEGLLNGEFFVANWSRGGKLVMSSTISQGVDPRNTHRSWFWRWRLRKCAVEIVGWS